MCRSECCSTVLFSVLLPRDDVRSGCSCDVRTCDMCNRLLRGVVGVHLGIVTKALSLREFLFTTLLLGQHSGGF